MFCVSSGIVDDDAATLDTTVIGWTV